MNVTRAGQKLLQLSVAFSASVATLAHGGEPPGPPAPRGVGLDGLTEAIYYFGPVLAKLCAFIGFVIIGVALVKGATLSKPDGGGTSKVSIVVASLLTGAFLVNLSFIIDTMSVSLGFSTEASLVLGEFGGGPQDYIKGTFATSDSAFADYSSGINFAFAIIQIVGAIAVARGIILIKKSSHGGGGGQGASVGHAATHLIGGTLALNIKPFLGILGNTMGGDANSIIQLIIDGVTRV